MYKGLTKEQIQAAIDNMTPQKPRRHELGGGYYYTCHWLKCGETLTRWHNYCPKCGQRIDWEAYT